MPPLAATAGPSAGHRRSISNSGGRLGRIRVRTNALVSGDMYIAEAPYGHGVDSDWLCGTFCLTGNEQAALKVVLVPVPSVSRPGIWERVSGLGSQHPASEIEPGLWRMELVNHPSGRKMVAGYFGGEWRNVYGCLVGVDIPYGKPISKHRTTYGGIPKYSESEFRADIWRLEKGRYLKFVWSDSATVPEKERLPVPILRKVNNPAGALAINVAHRAETETDNEVELEFEPINVD